VYPAPETLTFEIVTFELPPFVNDTGSVLLLLILMFEKFRLDWPGLSKKVAAPTVSVAALLVVLPAPLLTVTVNCEPLSAVVVTGVVYDDAVAPPTATPPFFH
jgi:hypothetical protein